MSDIASLDFLARKYQAFLMVDEAHATGVFGKSGAGLLEELLYRGDHIVSTHSCGKALGSFGSFVACSNKVYEIIKNLSRSFICTTAPPPYLTAHVHAVLRRIQNESVLRERLFENIAHARGILKTKSPIISVSVNNDQCALFIREHMAQNGFDIAVFRYPSVPKDRVQLRITLHSGNTSEQIDRLQKELEGIL